MNNTLFELALHFTQTSKQDLIDNNVEISEVYDVLNNGSGNRFGSHLVFIYKGLEVRTCSKAFIIFKIDKYQNTFEEKLALSCISTEYRQAMTL